jgi:hypothetical protein
MFYEPMFNAGITFTIKPELNNCLFKYNLTFSYYNCPCKTIDMIYLTSDEDEKFWIEKQKSEAQLKMGEGKKTSQGSRSRNKSNFLDIIYPIHPKNM